MDIISKPVVTIPAYYLRISSFTIVGLSMLLLLQWIARGYVSPIGMGKPLDARYLAFPTCFLWSVPCAFLLWVRIVGRDHKFIPVFSPVACICSFIGFIAAAGLDINKYPLLVLFYAAAGTIAGLFIFIRFDDFCHYAFRQRRLTIIALLAASMSTIYSASDMFLWKQICLSTAMTVHWILDAFGMDVRATIDRHISNFPAVSLSSQYFNIQVLQGCSGLEGIFLFLFLLSAIILFDWEFFKNISFFETYLIGFIYMFLVNTLRIVTLFLIGHLAWMPGVSPWIASMRGLPLQVFHSVLGEIYYFIAFVIFAAALCKVVMLRRMECQG